MNDEPPDNRQLPINSRLEFRRRRHLRTMTDNALVSQFSDRLNATRRNNELLFQEIRDLGARRRAERLARINLFNRANVRNARTGRGITRDNLNDIIQFL